MSRDGYRVPPKTTWQLLIAATEFRKKFGCDNLLYFDIVRFIENAIPIFYSDFDFRVVEDYKLPNEQAITLPDEKVMIVREDVYNGAVLGRGRERFTMAHELAHLVIHAGIPKIYAQSKKGTQLKAYEDSEWQANTFAGQILAPTYLIKDRGITEIACECGVSFTVAEIQKRRLQQFYKIPPTGLSWHFSPSAQ